MLLDIIIPSTKDFGGEIVNKSGTLASNNAVFQLIIIAILLIILVLILFFVISKKRKVNN